jgi:two-component system, NtrC family, sensor histidine kinase HydH
VTRLTLLLLGLVFLAILAVGAGAWVWMQRDRAALVQTFAEERLRQVDAAGLGIQHDLADIGEDLRLASELLATGAPEDRAQELMALLRAVKHYKAVAIYERSGAERLRLLDRGAEDLPEPAQVSAGLLRTATRAFARPPGEVETSPGLPEASGWLRAFATALPSGELAVALLVDTEPFFSPLRLVASQPDTRLLVLGAFGRPTPASDPTLAAAMATRALEEGKLPAFAALTEVMRRGERGTVRIGDDEAGRLGLGSAEALAAYAPILVRGGAHWSVATVVSTSALRDHERALVLRLGLAAMAIAVLLGSFGAYAVVASRRAVALRESRRHADRLAHLHEKTQKILDSIPSGVLALSAAGAISAANRALKDALGKDPVGLRLSQALPLAPSPVAARLEALVSKALASGRAESILGEELSLFGAVGQYSLHAVPLEPRDPEVRALLVVEDLTDVHALESQLLRAEKLATVGVLAAGIAHEVGTPLGVVRGRAEYVLGKLGAAHPQADSLAVMVEQIDRVSRTIRQLLDFSRVQPAQVRPVALLPLAHSVKELLGLEADRRQVALRVEVPEALPSLAADPDQLQQVLVNLVLNACDACGPGGKVTVSAQPEDATQKGAWGRVRIVVRDDGAGIPTELQHQVFDPFFTTKKRGQGTGLGLALVAQITRNHGGQVELTSEVDQGTMVALLWPSAEESQVRHAHA